MSESKREEVTAGASNDFVEKLKTTSPRIEAQKTRLVRPKPAELGTHIAGRDSKHTYLIELPQTFDSVSGSAMASAVMETFPGLRPTHAFTPAYTLEPGDEPKKFELDFAPDTRGDYTAEVKFMASWADGHVEQAFLPVHARATELTDLRNAAAEHEPADTIGRDVEPKVTPEDGTKPVTLALAQAKSELDAVMTEMFDAQIAGISDAQDEQNEFRRRPPALPLWVDLVQIALETGLSVVSERLGSLIGGRFAKFLGKEFSEKHETVVKSFEKMVDSGFEASVKATKVLEVEPAEGKEKKERTTGEGDDRSGEKREPERQTSTNAKIQFFGAQRRALSHAQAGARISVSRGVTYLAAQLGPNAPQVMDQLSSIQDAVATQTKTVEVAQGDASVAQWMKFRARAELGIENESSNTMTTMTEARAHDVGTQRVQGKSADGLLELFAYELDGSFRLLSARVTGIASSSTDRLLEMNLKSARMPIAIRIRGTTVTVDEAGRVRADGPVREHHDGIPWSEVSDADDAQQLVDWVTSSTLSSKGLKEIGTDDVGTQK